MDPEEQVNKSNQDVHMWRMNGYNGENNGQSLILLLLGSIPEYRFSTGNVSVLIKNQDRPKMTI